MLPDRVALLERLALAASRLGFVPPIFPAPYFDGYVGAMTSRALMAATSLGIFAALAEQPDNVAGLARRTGLVEERLEAFLPVLITLGYVRLRGGRYRLTRTAKRWLDPGARKPLDAVVGKLAYWNWRGMDALEDVLRGGTPVGLHERPADDPLWPDYQAAMAQLAGLTADEIAAAIPVERPQRSLASAWRAKGSPSGSTISLAISSRSTSAAATTWSPRTRSSTTSGQSAASSCFVVATRACGRLA